MKKHKAIIPILALTLLVGAFFFPVTAHAQSDTTPPTVTAELNGDMLKVTAKDDSGVEAIYVGETRFSTLVNGTANILLKDYAGSGAKVAISATDTAGNRSQPVMIDNPYYQAPAVSTPAPSASSAPAASTPAPSSSSTPAPSASSTPEPTSTPDVTSPPASEDGGNTPTESVIPDGTGAFTPDGDGTVLDNATQEEGKEFFTITATDGSVYYLIIDRVRGTENVYFLSAVTREDLVSLADNGADTTPGLTQPEPQTPDPPAQTPEPVDEPAQDEGGGNMGTIIFILIAVAAVGGAAYYFKVLKPRKEAARQDEYEEEDYEDDPDGEGEDDEYFFDEPGAEGTED